MEADSMIIWGGSGTVKSVRDLAALTPAPSLPMIFEVEACFTSDGIGRLATSQAQYQVRALSRALALLNAFSLARPELSLSAVAASAHLAPSTALRLLAILAD